VKSNLQELINGGGHVLALHSRPTVTRR